MVYHSLHYLGILITYTVSPLYLWALRLWIQPTANQIYWGGGRFKHSLNWLGAQQLFIQYSHCMYNYLCSIYIVLGIVSNPEMTYEGCAQVICKYYAILHEGPEHP